MSEPLRMLRMMIDHTELLRLLRSGCAVTPHQIQAAEEIERMRYPRQEIRRFARIMEQKLREHDDRNGWDQCDWDWLHDRMLEEARELFDLLAPLEDPHWDNPVGVGREAADVANFAMMIADRCRALEGGGEDE